jgi:hypothetical protein
VNQLRARLTYANVMSTIAVFLVIGGATAFAALGKGTVGTKQLKNNAVTAKKIKKNAVSSAKIKKNAVTAAKIKNSAVTAAKIAAGAVGAGQLGANSVGNASTELVKVFKGKVVPSVGEEASSPRIELGSVGPFRFYGKCFKSGANVEEKTYIELTSGVATLGSEDGAELPTPGTQEYLTPSTLEANRAMEDDASAAAGKVSGVSNDEEFQATASNGTQITGLIGGTAAKQGEPAIGNGPLLPGDSCIVGAIAIFGS